MATGSLMHFSQVLGRVILRQHFIDILLAADNGPTSIAFSPY